MNGGDSAPIESVAAVFVRIETLQGREAWGCAAFDSAITGETKEDVRRAASDVPGVGCSVDL